MTQDDHLGKPFDSIESAQEFVHLLTQSIAEAKAEIESQLASHADPDQARREQALHLVLFKLESLSIQMTKSQRILNDLRTLRRLLLEGSASSASV